MKERYQSALGQDGRRIEKGKRNRQGTVAALLLIFEWLQVMVMGTGTWQIGVAIVSVDIVSHIQTHQRHKLWER